MGVGRLNWKLKPSLFSSLYEIPRKNSDPTAKGVFFCIM